jgi:hypothetical protein
MQLRRVVPSSFAAVTACFVAGTARAQLPIPPADERRVIPIERPCPTELELLRPRLEVLCGRVSHERWLVDGDEIAQLEATVERNLMLPPRWRVRLREDPSAAAGGASPFVATAAKEYFTALLIEQSGLRLQTAISFDQRWVLIGDLRVEPMSLGTVLVRIRAAVASLDLGDLVVTSISPRTSNAPNGVPCLGLTVSVRSRGDSPWFEACFDGVVEELRGAASDARANVVRERRIDCGLREIFQMRDVAARAPGLCLHAQAYSGPDPYPVFVTDRSRSRRGGEVWLFGMRGQHPPSCEGPPTLSVADVALTIDAARAWFDDLGASVDPEREQILVVAGAKQESRLDVVIAPRELSLDAPAGLCWLRWSFDAAGSAVRTREQPNVRGISRRYERFRFYWRIDLAGEAPAEFSIAEQPTWNCGADPDLEPLGHQGPTKLAVAGGTIKELSGN